MAFTITRRDAIDLASYIVRPFSTGMARAFVASFHASDADASDIVNYSASNVASLRRAIAQVAGMKPANERAATKDGKPVLNKDGSPRMLRSYTKSQVSEALASLGITIEPLAKSASDDRELIQLVRTPIDQ